MENNKYLLSVQEASEYFSIGRDKLYQLIRTEEDLPIIKIGKVNKFNKPLMEIWLNNVTEEGRDL